MALVTTIECLSQAYIQGIGGDTSGISRRTAQQVEAVGTAKKITMYINKQNSYQL
jgi:hypothetical protein